MRLMCVCVCVFGLCVYQVNVGSVAFPDVLPTYTFCEASPEEVERALLEAQTQGYAHAALTTLWGRSVERGLSHCLCLIVYR